MKFWYTYCTDMQAYTLPHGNYIIALVGLKTANDLEKQPFFIMPSHTTRHKPDIYKESIQLLYENYKRYIRIQVDDSLDWTYKIEYYAKVIER
jgi:hypothetical protein